MSMPSLEEPTLPPSGSPLSVRKTVGKQEWFIYDSFRERKGTTRYMSVVDALSDLIPLQQGDRR